MASPKSRAPINEEARKVNSIFPGMGGYNTINLHLYHYAGNNPVKYLDPDGNDYVTAIYDKSDKTLTVTYTVETNGREFNLPTLTFFAESKVRNEFNGRASPNVRTFPADGSTPQYYYPRMIPNGIHRIFQSRHYEEGTERHKTFGDVFIPTSAVQEVPVYGVTFPVKNPITGEYTSTGKQKDTGYGVHFAIWTWGCIGMEQDDVNIYAYLSDKALQTENGRSTLTVQE